MTKLIASLGIVVIGAALGAAAMAYIKERDKKCGCNCDCCWMCDNDEEISNEMEHAISEE